MGFDHNNNSYALAGEGTYCLFLYLIDEVTAVGDPQFKSKSQAVMKERLTRSKVIMVSHAMSEIVKYCDVVVLVDRGNTVLYTDLKKGIAAYQQQGLPTPPAVLAAPQDAPRPAAAQALLASVATALPASVSTTQT